MHKNNVADPTERQEPTSETLDNYKELTRLSRIIDYSQQPFKFAKAIFEEYVTQNDDWKNKRVGFAALFDLAVTACYLEKVADQGWVYCHQPEQSVLTYPFVNACPRCTLAGTFAYTKGKKPKSAAIGKTTSNILAAFLDLTIKKSHPSHHIRILNDSGVVDAYLKGPKSLVLFEIKSAPLVPFPIVTETAEITEYDEVTGEKKLLENHSQTRVDQNAQSFLIIDTELRIPVGMPKNYKTGNHYEIIYDWLKQANNLERYTASWLETFDGYANPSRRSETYWLTNGCGTPKPRPADWPKLSSGNGYRTISDGKSSVGMDRTDDLKKGIYQVLKISTHYKEHFPSENREVYAALASNIHAVKHRSEYISELENIAWTVDGEAKSYVTLNDDGSFRVEKGKLYNLFDAIITFTESHFRSDFIKDLYE